MAWLLIARIGVSKANHVPDLKIQPINIETTLTINNYSNEPGSQQ